MRYGQLVALGLSLACGTVYALDPGVPPPANPANTTFFKAVVDVSMVQEAIDLQKKIDEQSNKDAPPSVETFVVLQGSGPVIVTAPHATEPYRDGKYRFADGGGTAALAHLLNKLSCATVIYTQYRSPSDPNFYDDNGFKQALADLIKQKKPKLLLDLHGSHDYRPYDVDLGTMDGASLLGNDTLQTSLIRALEREGMLNFSNNFFSASKNQTITRFASSRGVPTLQLEISNTWLMPSEEGVAAHRFAQLLQGLTRYVRDLSGNPNGNCQAPTLD